MTDTERLALVEDVSLLHLQSLALHSDVLEAHAQRLERLDAIVDQQKRILASLAEALAQHTDHLARLDALLGQHVALAETLRNIIEGYAQHVQVALLRRLVAQDDTLGQMTQTLDAIKGLLDGGSGH